MKKLFLLFLISGFCMQSNAQFNFSFTDGGIPVVGTQYGVVGGVHSAMLFNRDDVTSELIKMQTMNLTYFGGLERVQWKTPHFGFGQQLLYWFGGAKYSGKIFPTDDSPTIDATTSLTYIKIPALFWYKSYSRWHPDRRIRVNTFFGPYAALLIDGQEEYTYQQPGTDINNTYLIKPKTYEGKDKDGNDVGQFLSADEGQMFKPFDWGFTMGGGISFRLWRKTVIGLTLRADLGMTEVEDKDFDVQVAGTEYGFYRDILSKHVPINGALGPDYNHNRPETSNNSFGLQLSIRKYFGVK